MINIIIPSFKRSKNLVGKDYFFMAKYCVPESQKKDYIESVGKDRVIVLPDSEDGNIIKKRNWILKNIPKPLIMIDDDVKNIQFWDKRKNNYLSKEFPKELLNDLFEEFVNMAIQFDVKLFGLSQNQDDRQYREFLPFSLSNLILGPFQGHLEHEMIFDKRVGTKDDYDMALQHLNKYKKILRFNKYAYDCEHGDNKGGIVSYRSKEKEIQYCKAIMLKWGKKIIQYKIPPTKMTDLLNAKQVNVPINGV
tara:strand:- start:59 stop:808 length:750 start_codon:yes stop_codon:yes gene_type:complete